MTHLLLLLRHGSFLVACDARRHLAGMEVGLSESDLQLAKDASAFGIEVLRSPGERIDVGARKQRPEPEEQVARSGTPALAVDLRHGLQRGCGRKARRPWQRLVQ